MNPPTITISGGDAEQVARDRDASAKLASAIIKKVSRPPYFTLVRGIPPTDNPILTLTMARLIVNQPPVKAGTTAQDRSTVSFTRVHIDPAKAKQKGTTTAYSRTNRPLDLHTDSSYMDDPHELVIFQFVRADREGGHSIMAAVNDIVAELSPDALRTLSQPIFPFAGKPKPVLWRCNGQIDIRYYRAQIENAVNRGDMPPPSVFDAIDELDAALSRESILHRFHIASGETIFINNKKALHGRTGMAPDSDRLMIRVRTHAGCLE